MWFLKKVKRNDDGTAAKSGLKLFPQIRNRFLLRATLGSND